MVKLMGTRKKTINVAKAQNELLDAIGEETTVADAAKAASISLSTVHRWRRCYGRDGEQDAGHYTQRDFGGGAVDRR